nr:hypothetical protein [Tanacetum cinerariifolium]
IPSPTTILAFLQSITALAVANNPLPIRYDLVPSTNPVKFLVSSNIPIFSVLKRYNGIKFTQDPKSAKYEHAAMNLTRPRLAAATIRNTYMFSMNTACDQIEFQRIFSTEFCSCTSRSHYQNVSKQTTRYE